jgi:hypothetical protein
MSLRERISDLFNRTNDDTDELELIRELLAEREAELVLEAEYGRPYPNMTEEPTVVFPYTLFTSDGDVYGAGSKEFRIPDDGLSNGTSNLAQFIAERQDIEADEVSFTDLASVDGTTANAELAETGDVLIGGGN